MAAKETPQPLPNAYDPPADTPPQNPGIPLIVYLGLFISLTILTIATTIEHADQNHSRAMDLTLTAMVPLFESNLEAPAPAAQIQRTFDAMAIRSGFTANVTAPDTTGVPTIVASTDHKAIGGPASERQSRVLRTGLREFGSCLHLGLPALCIHHPLKDATGRTAAVLTFITPHASNTSVVWLYSGVTAFLFMLVAVLLHRQQRKTHRELERRKRTEAQLRQIIDLVPHLIFAKDENSRYILANTTVAAIHGLHPSQLIGRRQDELTSPTPEQTVRYMMDDRRVIRSGRPKLGFEQEIDTADGKRLVLVASKIPFTTAGRPAVLGVGIDITERKAMEAELRRHRDRLEELVAERTLELERTNTRLLREVNERKAIQKMMQQSISDKEVLLHEVHHRVMNNLQVISGLVDMAGRRATTPEMRTLAEDIGAKIHSISLVHTQLYQSENLDNIDFVRYAHDLCTHLRHVFGMHRVRLDFDTAPLRLPIGMASPCGMVLNELVSNSFKHAFHAERAGTLHVGIHTCDGTAILTVRDDGPGLPQGFVPAGASGMGMRLVANIVTFQLRGSLDMTTENGTAVRIAFPLPAKPEQPEAQEPSDAYRPPRTSASSMTHTQTANPAPVAKTPSSPHRA
ncbi:PAS domain S-box-containing protein [Desulfobaculum xiamenense]|uniref:PAS domain S-box-containing protein n=1 Tax=Desulfobaculum xiamenense TaxID=995050 RepID=A0A846QQI6_9BACT|nr:histidine kinase dimerization/phosphoacceptor domain -containing protein [Desulfobaculum xiamenense]NJB67655.1 PAS domain S-box-containing protein [Desulfobaculum xiamenense]